MKRILIAVGIVTALAGTAVLAQPGSMGGPPGINAGITKFFGNNTSFTSKAEFIMQGSSQSAPMSMEANFKLLEGKLRLEMDMSSMAGGSAARMKQMGMDKMVNIARPDTKMTYRIFPGLKAYLETPMNDKQVAEAAQDYKLEKTSLGKETVDGHPCEKYKVVATNDKGEKHEVLVWNATDLKDFPVQMQMDENGNSMLMKFKDVKLEKPDVKLFEPPAGFTKYENMQTMMRTEMMKRAGAGGPPQ